MTTYHLLAKPLQRLPDGKVVWETNCGLKVSLAKVCHPGGTVQTADKRGNEIIECASCYAAEDQSGQPQSQRQAAPDPLSARTTSASNEERGDDAILGEESEEYPG